MKATCPRCGNSVSGVHTCNPVTISLDALNELVATKIGGWTHNPKDFIEGSDVNFGWWRRLGVEDSPAWESPEEHDDARLAPDYCLSNPLWNRTQEVVNFCLAADPSGCRFASELPVFNEDGDEVSLAIRVMTLTPAQICLAAVKSLGLVAPDVELETEVTP